MNNKFGSDGKPLDFSYLEKDLPHYLQHDIDVYLKGRKENSSLIDCMLDEIYGSINSAEVDGEITHEQAAYLRKKYLYGEAES